MGSSLLFNNRLRIVLAGVFSFQLVTTPLLAELPRPFPVLGAVTVSEGHWNDAPEVLNKLSDKVLEESLRFQITSSAGSSFSIFLLEESRRAFQRLLKAKKPSPSLFIQQMSNLRLAEISLLEGRADDAIRQAAPFLNDGNPYIAQEAIFLQARSQLVKRDWAPLNATVRQLIQKFPAYSNDLALNLLRGLAALEQGHPDETLLFVKRYPNEPSGAVLSGRGLHQKERDFRGAPALSANSAENPNSGMGRSHAHDFGRSLLHGS